MPRTQSSNQHGYRRYHSARLRTQRLTSREARLVVLVIAAAVLGSVACTATWANASISLQFVTDSVGQWTPHEPEHRLVGATPAEGSECTNTFADEFASLSQATGDVMGQPLGCAHADPATGDVLQATSTGLAVYRPGSHDAMFTDGYRHWALGTQGLVTWEGDAGDPPG
jgi:hypothetical protein